MYKSSPIRPVEGKHVSVEQAQRLILGEARDFGIERIRLEETFERVLAEDISADRNYPPFNRSAVDGFAIRVQDLLDQEPFEIIEEVLAGEVAKNSVRFKSAIKIMTGAPVPFGADAVIKVEEAEVKNKMVRFAIKTVPHYANISSEGEDAQQGDLVIHRGQRCTAHVMGTLAALGKAAVQVYKLPVIYILSTGNELRSPDQPVLPHQIRDSNAFSLIGFFKQYGIPVKEKYIVRDDKPELLKAIQATSDADILLLSGGVSMGDADFVPEVLHRAGIKKVFHKAAIKPGKPIWFGTKEKQAVFALPGNPFSVQVGFKIFIEPYIRQCLHLPPLTAFTLPLQGTKRKKTSFDEYFPCRIKGSSLEPVSFNGSGDIKAALLSDGLALHPASAGEIKDGETVRFYFWKNPF